MARAVLVRSGAVVVALVAALALGSTTALACSCLPETVAERLAAGRPAMIGIVIAERDDEPEKGSYEDHLHTYTVRVERAFNAALPAEIAIQGSTSGASCGFTWNVGQRVGAFLWGAGDSWHTSSCSLATPAALELAASPPLPPLPPTDDPPSPSGGPGAGDATGLRARRGRAIVAGGPRSGTLPGRLVVAAGARIRLRLDESATAVRTGLAGAGGARLSRMRSARAAGRAGRTWVASLPGSLPHRVDRLLVAIERDGERVVLAVGITATPPHARSVRHPSPRCAPASPSPPSAS